MKRSPLRELLGYVAISVGMALSASNYSVLAEVLSGASFASVFTAVIVAGVLCCVVACSVGELASSYPSAPGVRTYLRGTLGNRVSLWATFALLLATMLFAAIETEVLAETLHLVVPWVPRVAVIVIAIVLPVALNCIGMEIPRTAQNLLCAALVFGTVVAAGATVSHHGVSIEPSTFKTLDAGAWATLVGTAVFLYMGFEWVTPLGRTPDAYKQRIPLAMLLALVTLAAIYYLTGLAFSLGLGGSERNAIAPHVSIAGAAYGSKGRICAALLSVAATVTTFNAGVLGASRLVYALAREGVLPKGLSRLAERNGTPYASILAMGSGALVVSLAAHATGTALAAALACAGVYGVIYACLSIAAMRQRSRPLIAGQFRAPLPRWLLGGAGIAVGLFGVSAPVGTPGVRSMATAAFAGTLLLSALGASLAAAGHGPRAQRQRVSEPSLDTQRLPQQP